MANEHQENSSVSTLPANPAGVADQSNAPKDTDREWSLEELLNEHGQNRPHGRAVNRLIAFVFGFFWKPAKDRTAIQDGVFGIISELVQKPFTRLVRAELARSGNDTALNDAVGAEVRGLYKTADKIKAAICEEVDRQLGLAYLIADTRHNMPKNGSGVSFLSRLYGVLEDKQMAKAAAAYQAGISTEKPAAKK